MRSVGGAARRRRSRREGLREALTIVAASVAACAAGAASLSLLKSADYESTAVVSGASRDAPLRSAAVARRALAAAGARGEPPAALLGHLEAERQPGGRAAFTVSAGEPVAARRLAGSYARAWAASAQARAGPARPARQERDTWRAALTGAAAGLLAGLLLAVAREALDVRRASSRSVRARLGFEQLGRVPEPPDGIEEAYRMPAREAPDGDVARAYERLAATVVAAARAASARVILVCGTVAEDRGESVAAGLAAALAGTGRSVAVVEVGAARPALRRQFALPRGPGFAEVARGEATVDEALARVRGLAGVTVLSAGAGPAPAGDAAEQVLTALRDRFDVVVVAGPPLLSEGARPPAGVDALLLTVSLRRIRQSRRPRVERVLEEHGVPVLGFVLMASVGPASPGGAAHLSEARA